MIGSSTAGCGERTEVVSQSATMGRVSTETHLLALLEVDGDRWSDLDEASKRGPSRGGAGGRPLRSSLDVGAVELDDTGDESETGERDDGGGRIGPDSVAEEAEDGASGGDGSHGCEYVEARRRCSVE